MSNSINALNCVVQVDIPKEKFTETCCFCREKTEKVVISCSVCKENMHISCIFSKNFKVSSDSFDCGCSDKRKPAKKKKTLDLPPIRGPSSCSILEQIMEKIIRADNLMLFRTSPCKLSESYKENVLESLSAKCFIDSTPDFLTIIISKAEGQPTKKLKLQTPPNILRFSDISDVVGKDEPKYINNYRIYESEKLTSLDHMYNYYIRGHAYFSIFQIKNDIRRMILNKLQNSKTMQEKIYINHFWNIAMAELCENTQVFQDAVLTD